MPRGLRTYRCGPAVAATLAAFGACAGCGDATGAPSFSFPKPIPAGLTCLDEAAAFSGLTADAYVAGFEEPCPLDVDPNNYTVTGSCGAIPVGIVRHVMIVYTRPADSTSVAVTLAYTIGSVDLRRDQLPEDTSQPITVRLQGTDTIYEQTVIDGIVIDGPDCTYRDASDPLQWAKCWIEYPLGTSLICGGSTVPNMVRACAGTLACP